jgi:hypothetical protein
MHKIIGKNDYYTINLNQTIMKKYLLFLLFATCSYTMGFTKPFIGKPALNACESNQFFTIYTVYQSSADDGGNLIEYPQAYNYVTPNTTVWLFVTYPSGTPSWSWEGGTASTGQWNSSLGAWEFYMPYGGWGIFQVTVGGQTAMYTILANDYLDVPVVTNPSKNTTAEAKEATQPTKNLSFANSIQYHGLAKNLAAILQRNSRQQQKK